MRTERLAQPPLEVACEFRGDAPALDARREFGERFARGAHQNAEQAAAIRCCVHLAPGLDARPQRDPAAQAETASVGRTQLRLFGLGQGQFDAVTGVAVQPRDQRGREGQTVFDEHAASGNEKAVDDSERTLVDGANAGKEPSDEDHREGDENAPAARSSHPASLAATSVYSHVNSGSVRPK